MNPLLQQIPVSYPVIYLTVSDGVVDAIARASGCRQGLVANEEVEILGASLPRQVSARSSTAGQKRRLVRDGRTS